MHISQVQKLNINHKCARDKSHTHIQSSQCGGIMALLCIKLVCDVHSHASNNRDLS